MPAKAVSSIIRLIMSEITLQNVVEIRNIVIDSVSEYLLFSLDCFKLV